MAWTKTPLANDGLFRTALPRDPRIVLTKMFGCLIGLVHGRMYAGTFGRSVFIRLAPDDRSEALRLDGAELFDPMSKGGLREMVFFPEAVMDERAELEDWLRRGLAYAVTLPPKNQRGVKKPPAKKPSLLAKTRVSKQKKSRS
ncbi:hypothetical protein BH11MYX1_BH11MYX1_19810 [soil metagenome]